MPSVGTCAGMARIAAPGRQDTLSSVVTAATGCGGDVTPWVIQAQPGQTVNLTLWDFGSGQNEALMDTSACAFYAHIEVSVDL